jgi:hypothetical protein
MKRLIVAAALAAAGVAMPAYSATDAECRDLWKKADANNDGVLAEAEAMPYGAMMRIRDQAIPPNAQITQAAFMDACKENVYAPQANEPGAPLKGANSFTEGQAKDRAEARGLTNVTGLKKDDDGIWRGTASKDGKSVQVAVDYKGNVVTAEQ